MSSPLKTSDWIELCRVLRHSLNAGLTLVDVMRSKASRGSGRIRDLADRLLVRLKAGESLSDSLEPETVPVLLKNMVRVGEEIGNLPEVFGELEEYYRAQQKMVRDFWAKAFMPIVQFCFAVFIIAGVLWLLGFIAQMNRTPPLITFFGLSGAPASFAFLSCVAAFVALIVFSRWLFATLLPGNPVFDNVIRTVPLVGPCVTSLAMNRFCVACQLTLGGGLNVLKALRLCLEATGNAHFQTMVPQVTYEIRNGRSVTEALNATGAFSEEFIGVMLSAEEAGSIPETMRHQAQFYKEESLRYMTQLTGVATGFVFFLYGSFVVIAIFMIANIYLSQLKV